jgi:hypothetical protein
MMMLKCFFFFLGTFLMKKFEKFCQKYRKMFGKKIYIFLYNLLSIKMLDPFGDDHQMMRLNTNSLEKH